MNRQILFRGKALIGGEWIYGGYTYDDSDKDHMITQVNEDGLVVGYAVDPATVGQFTGLTDSKGNKVFEGDVLIYIATSMSSMEVKFENGCFVGEGPFNTHPLSIYLNSGDFESIEVSGTVHDTHLIQQFMSKSKISKEVDNSTLHKTSVSHSMPGGGMNSLEFFDMIKKEWCRSEEQYRPFWNDVLTFARKYHKERKEYGG